MTDRRDRPNSGCEIVGHFIDIHRIEGVGLTYLIVGNGRNLFVRANTAPIFAVKTEAVEEILANEREFLYYYACYSFWLIKGNSPQRSRPLHRHKLEGMSLVMKCCVPCGREGNFSKIRMNICIYIYYNISIYIIIYNSCVHINIYARAIM